MAVVQRCGTVRGYWRHRRRGEAPCGPCYAARAEYVRQWRARPRTSTEHGYGPYTQGCRCEVCVAAKREYTRTRRREASQRRARAEADGRGRHYVPGITHGYSGYQNFACRCEVCVAAKQDYHQRSSSASA